ncbi:MAG: hypothetical protein Q8K32_10740 [Archangium sp.]|nr:hypothetical protein [Archangium sp.]
MRWLNRLLGGELKTDEYEVRDSQHGLGRVFILRGPWRPEYPDFMRRQGIDGLRLGDSAGPDVGFLSEVPFLRSLEIYSRAVRDCSVLSSLNELRLLGLQCELRGSIDFGPLAKLEVALLSWEKAVDGVLGCRQLRHLNVSGWPEVDLSKLAQLDKLQALYLQSRRLQSLHGLSAFPVLEHLDLHGCPKLASLAGVEACQRLTSLSVSACRVGDVSVLASLPGLRTVELDSCGDIGTFAPLAALHDLERLSFDGNTRVLDGDLSVIEGFPKLHSLVFAPRGLYNRNRTELLSRRA